MGFSSIWAWYWQFEQFEQFICQPGCVYNIWCKCEKENMHVTSSKEKQKQNKKQQNTYKQWKTKQMQLKMNNQHWNIGYHISTSQLLQSSSKVYTTSRGPFKFEQGKWEIS